MAPNGRGEWHSPYLPGMGWKNAYGAGRIRLDGRARANAPRGPLSGVRLAHVVRLKMDKAP